jgi:lipoprotein LprG
MSTTRAALALAAVSFALTACVGQDDNGGGGDDKVCKDLSADECLAEAKTLLDDTSGVHLEITGNPPSGQQGLESASGVATHDPVAFKGEATVGGSFDVIAIGDDVWVDFGIGFTMFDPSTVGAPNPAALFESEGGLSDFLVKTDGVEEGESERGGANNEDVFGTYSGTLDGKLVESVIPSAEGEFAVDYLIDTDGRLREARITGAFYGEDAAESTYTISLEDYGTEQEIKAP